MLEFVMNERSIWSGVANLHNPIFPQDSSSACGVLQNDNTISTVIARPFPAGKAKQSLPFNIVRAAHYYLYKK
jgi:hypothetical protein